MSYTKFNTKIWLKRNQSKIAFVSIFLTGIFVLFLFGSWIRFQISIIPEAKSLKTNSVNNEVMEEDLPEMVDNYCRNLDQRFYIESNPESESILTRAKRAKIVRETLIFFPSLSQMWCLVPKAASTSWSKILIQAIAGNNSGNNSIQASNLGKMNETSNKTTPLQVILKEKYGHINKNLYIDAVRNEDIKKILLVRHPFARIASAYRDKLRNRKINSDGSYFYQHYGALIIRKYRKDWRLKQREPTFAEFVDFLIDKDPIEYDEHWQPISLLCGLCHVKYHVIIRTESVGHKSQAGILRNLGFNPEVKLPWENRRAEGHSSWISNYYKNISRSKMVLLYKKYEIDFHIFNYSFLQYYFP